MSRESREQTKRKRLWNHRTASGRRRASRAWRNDGTRAGGVVRGLLTELLVEQFRSRRGTRRHVALSFRETALSCERENDRKRERERREPISSSQKRRNGTAASGDSTRETEGAQKKTETNADTKILGTTDGFSRAGGNGPGGKEQLVRLAPLIP